MLFLRYIFFEIWNNGIARGDIGYAYSNSQSAHELLQSKNWHYGSVVVHEDFHLSYPYVFKHQDTWYMW